MEFSDSINPNYQDPDNELKAKPTLNPDEINPHYDGVPQLSVPTGRNFQGPDSSIPMGVRPNISEPAINDNPSKIPTRGIPYQNQVLETHQIPPGTVTGTRTNLKIPAYNCEYLWVFYLILLIIEFLLIIFIGVYFKIPDLDSDDSDGIANIQNNQTFFNALTILFLLGMGLLHAYLRHHTWTSVTVNFLVGVFGIQLGILFVTFWENVFSDYKKGYLKDEEDVNYFAKGRKLSYRVLMKAEMNALTTMVTITTLVGKLTIPQYFILAILEGFFSSFNYALIITCMQTWDDGGSLYVYCFGGFFGIGIALILYCGQDASRIQKWRENHDGASTYSGILALIGTILIWVFMPAVNGALSPLTTSKHLSDIINEIFQTTADENNSIAGSYTITYVYQIMSQFKYRAFVNTYLSLIGSVVGTGIMSAILNSGRLTIQHILFASLSGGVIIAGPGSINEYPYSSLVVGLFSGFFCSLLYQIIKPMFNNANLFDTLGGINLFGIHGLLGGVLTCIYIATLGNDDLKQLICFHGRSLSKLASLECASLFITIGIALATGFITGILLYALPLGETIRYFVDSEHFENESEPFPEYPESNPQFYLRQPPRNVPIGSAYIY